MFKKKKREETPWHEVRVYGTGADWNNGRWYAFVPELGTQLGPYPSRSVLGQEVRVMVRDLLDDGDPWGGWVNLTPALASEVVAAGIEL